MAASLALLLCNLLCVMAAPVGSRATSAPHASIVDFLATAPAHVAEAIKHPETIGAASNLLPIFWAQHPSDVDGSSPSSAKANVRLLAGLSACILLAVVVTRLLRNTRKQPLRLPLTEDKTYPVEKDSSADAHHR